MKIPKKLKLNSSGMLSNITELQKTIVYRLILLLFVIVLVFVILFAQTIAWQTNVVHTGGLMLSADSWNFSAEVTMLEQNTPASPGDTGIIEMQITNDSSDLAVASVRASKEQITEKMRHRLFFYADISTVQNGETVDVVYINTVNSYTYTVFPHRELVLNAEAVGQPVIKWEWTYDDLGYYVYGKKTESGTIQVEDYLRPITYTFDHMRTTFRADGKLETVDGVLTAEDFLLSFSKTDGYQGQINVAAVTDDGYYPVTFNDETGYGVFAYLCTLDEINQGSFHDAALGNNAEAIGQATIRFTGQNSNSDGALVFDEESLKTALSTPGLNILTLNQDIALMTPVSISGGAQAVIDLAGHTITSAADTVIDAKNGALLILNNGEIVGNGGTGVSAIGSYVTLNDMTVTSVKEGIVVYDQKSNLKNDSVVHLANCHVNAQEDGLLIYGNAAVSDENTKIVVENCEIIGQQYAGVICNGTQYGTDISVENSTVKGKYTGIYFPQKDSVLRVSTSNIEGYTGIAVKGGTVHITDSTVTGTGEYSPLPEDPSQLPMSGWWDTGDGVYLEANYSQWQTSVFISGESTKITGTKEGTLAVRLYPANASQASIKIGGGVFSSDVTPFLKEGCRVNSTADGYTVVNN